MSKTKATEVRQLLQKVTSGAIDPLAFGRMERIARIGTLLQDQIDQIRPHDGRCESCRWWDVSKEDRVRNHGAWDPHTEVFCLCVDQQARMTQARQGCRHFIQFDYGEKEATGEVEA